MKRWVIGGLIAVLLVGAGVFTWRTLNNPLADAGVAAERAAAALVSRQIGDGSFGPTIGNSEQERVADAYRGMGALRPTVRVASISLGPDDRTGTARLAVEWVIHQGKQPWAYDLYLKLRRGESGWHALWEPNLLGPDVTADERIQAVRLAPVRGEIIGQDEERLAWNAEGVRVGIDRSLVAADIATASAKKLAKLLGIEVDRYVARVTRAGPRAFVEAAVLRALVGTPEYSLLARATGIAGVRVVSVTRPFAISDRFARPVLGTVGEATAEIIEKSGGRIRPGDLVGLTGLQAARNTTLMGVTGFAIQAYHRDHPSEPRELFRVDSVPGASIRTTIDARLQRRAEAILDGVRPASAIVAIRPSDGALLVAASGPGGDGLSTSTRGQYAPGSVFKAVSGLAALRAGLTPSAKVSCPASVTVDGKRFDNHDGYPVGARGRVAFTRAFANSCNTAMIGLRDRVDAAALTSAAVGLGLEADPALGIAGFLGTTPTDVSAVEHAAAMIGQGKVLASPLGMATVAASIAAGTTVRPQLIVGEVPRPSPNPTVPLTSSEAASLRRLMGAVVSEGTARFLSDVPGRVLAKTGTASYGPTNPPRYHGWMIAIRGDLAVCVFVADGVGGASTAGPLLEKFLRAS